LSSVTPFHNGFICTSSLYCYEGFEGRNVNFLPGILNDRMRRKRTLEETKVVNQIKRKREIKQCNLECRQTTNPCLI